MPVQEISRLGLDEAEGIYTPQANRDLSRYVSVLTPPIPLWVPYVAGGETPTQLKSAKNLKNSLLINIEIKIRSTWST